MERTILVALATILLGTLILGYSGCEKVENIRLINYLQSWNWKFNSYYRMAKEAPGYLILRMDSSYEKEEGLVGADYADEDSDIVFRDPSRFRVTDDKIGYLATLLELQKERKEWPNVFEGITFSNIIITFGSDAVSQGERKVIVVAATSVSFDKSKAENKGEVFKKGISEMMLEGKDNGKGNFILIINLPKDNALFLDKYFDKSINGQKGILLCAKSYSEQLRIGEDWNFSSVIGIKGISSAGCGGKLSWGKENHEYVVAIYRID